MSLICLVVLSLVHAVADSRYRIVFLALGVLGIVLYRTTEQAGDIALPAEAIRPYEVDKEPVLIGRAGLAYCGEKGVKQSAGAGGDARPLR